MPLITPLMRGTGDNGSPSDEAVKAWYAEHGEEYSRLGARLSTLPCQGLPTFAFSLAICPCSDKMVTDAISALQSQIDAIRAAIQTRLQQIIPGFMLDPYMFPHEGVYAKSVNGRLIGGIWVEFFASPWAPHLLGTDIEHYGDYLPSDEDVVIKVSPELMLDFNALLASILSGRWNLCGHPDPGGPVVLHPASHSIFLEAPRRIWWTMSGTLDMSPSNFLISSASVDLTLTATDDLTVSQGVMTSNPVDRKLDLKDVSATGTLDQLLKTVIFGPLANISLASFIHPTVAHPTGLPSLGDVIASYIPTHLAAGPLMVPLFYKSVSVDPAIGIVVKGGIGA